MKSLLLPIASGLAAWAGMALLCFRSANQRHRLGWKELSVGQRKRFAAAAVALLLLSLAAAVIADGAAFGVLLWLCQAGLTGMALVCLLPFALACVAWGARVGACMAPLMLAVALWW